MHDEDFVYEGQTGFQSACTEYAKKPLSLDKLFGLGGPSLYIWRATGGEGKKFHIREGDLILVDSTLITPKIGHLYVVIVGSEHHLGQYVLIHNKPFLVPQMISLANDSDFETKVWGGIVAIINLYEKPRGIE